MSLTQRLILGSGLIFLLSGCKVPQNMHHLPLQNTHCYAAEQEVKKRGVDNYLQNIRELLDKSQGDSYVISCFVEYARLHAKDKFCEAAIKGINTLFGVRDIYGSFDLAKKLEDLPEAKDCKIKEEREYLEYLLTFL